MRRVAPILAAIACVLWFASAHAAESPAALFERGQLRRAEAEANTRLRARPDDHEALRVLARVRAQQRRYDEATKLAERAVAAAANDPHAHYALAEVFGIRAQRASVIHKPGLAKRFKKEAEATLALDPRHEDAMEAMIAFHREAPGIMGGDKKKGAEMLERLIQFHPTSGWTQKANDAFAAKDSASGEKFLREAVAAEGAPRAKLSLAAYLAAPWRKPAEAEKLAREVTQAEPWRTGAWAVLAAIEARGKRWSEMEATLREAEGALPGNLGPHYQAARLTLEEGGDPTRAEALLRRYLTVEPEIGAPSHGGAWWRISQALERQGKRPEAVAALRKSLELDPSLENAKKDLKRLKG